MRPISIFLPIVTLLLLILITGCSPSPNDDLQKAETANARTSDKPASETTSGFTDEELRSPEFKNCLLVMIEMANALDTHSHEYEWTRGISGDGLLWIPETTVGCDQGEDFLLRERAAVDLVSTGALSSDRTQLFHC